MQRLNDGIKLFRSLPGIVPRQFLPFRKRECLDGILSFSKLSFQFTDTVLKMLNFSLCKNHSFSPQHNLQTILNYTCENAEMIELENKQAK